MTPISDQLEVDVCLTSLSVKVVKAEGNRKSKMTTMTTFINNTRKWLVASMDRKAMLRRSRSVVSKPILMN